MNVKNNEMANLKAIQTSNIKHFLKEHYLFRAWVTFKDTGKRRTFYGNEHNVTLNQLIAGHKTEVIMDREKGYTDLIKMIEKTWKGKWKSANIYMRDPETNAFDILVRSYFNGQIEDEQSPVIEVRFVTIYFLGVQNYTSLFSKEPPATLPNFKKEIENNLSNKKLVK